MSDIIIPDAGYIGGIAQESRIIELSEDQERALDFVDNFINSDKKFAVIGGCAGSGKCSIIPYILKKYTSKKQATSCKKDRLPFFIFNSFWETIYA